jgi:hypothetical protein
MSLTAEQRGRAFANAVTFEAFVAGSANFTDKFRASFSATRLSEL